MSKTCLNCGCDISGEGKNKVFCDDCFKIMASFLRRLPASNEPAMDIYERTRPNFPAMGIGDKAALYLEKCCKRYDDGVEAQRASQNAVTNTPVSTTNDDGSAEDYPDPIPLPRRRRPTHMRETPRPGPAYDPRYDLGTNDRQRPSPDIDLTQTFSYNEPAPSYEQYQYREYSEAAAAVAAEETARAAAAPNRGRKAPAQNRYCEFDEEADGYGNDDGYSYDTVTSAASAASAQETKRRLYLILAAAVTAVILFAILAFSGLLTGNNKPKPPADGTEPGDSAQGNLPPAGTDTTAPVDTTDPSITDPPVTQPPETEPPVTTPDPATCLHQWGAATCTAASVCTICGAENGTALGHDYAAATCTEASKCTRCGEVTGSALGHSYSAPTCSAHGKCVRCGTVNTADTLAAHDYAPATCTEAQTCRMCDKTTGDPLGHDYTAEPTLTWNDDLTCSVKLVCSRSKSHTKDGGAAAVTHETTVEATCSTPGTETYTATAAVGDKTYTSTQTVEISTTGHKYEVGELQCSVCGQSVGGMNAIGFNDVTYGSTNLSLVVYNFSKSSGELSYIIINNDTIDSIEEGVFKLVVKSGDGIRLISPTYIDDNGRASLLAGEVREHTVRFNIAEGEEPLFIEFYIADFSETHFYSSNKNSALYWAP